MALHFAFVTLFMALCVGAIEDYQRNEEKFFTIERSLNEIREEMKLLSDALAQMLLCVEDIDQMNRKQISEHARRCPLVEEPKDAFLKVLAFEENVDDRIVPVSKNLAVMNDTELEERVTVLEFQMTNAQADITIINSDVSMVTEDLTTLETEVNDLEEDVEAQLTLLESDIFFIQSDQITQDERLQELEGNMEAVTGNLVDVNSAISSLEMTYQELNASLAEVWEIVDDLDDFVTDLDMRLDRLELNGTFAFHAVLDSYSSIPATTIVVFPFVNVNLGNGYNSATGVFTVPPGGGGLYYFHTHYLVQAGEVAGFGINRNEEILTFAEADGNGGGDYSATSCGAVTTLHEGDTVFVWCGYNTDDTPLFAGWDKPSQGSVLLRSELLSAAIDFHNSKVLVNL